MNVLHFLDTTNRGGAETQVLDICRNAREFGLNMTFVTAQGGTLEGDFRESGAEFIKLGRKFPIDLYLASQLRRIINGNTTIDGSYPKLAGQYATYLSKALHDYKSGERKNTIMAGFAATLSEQDIADLAAYFASQSGDIKDLSHLK